MDVDNPQYGHTRITKSSKATTLKNDKAKVNLITDTEEMKQGNAPSIRLDTTKRMSGAGTAKDMGEIFNTIAALKPKGN